MKRSVMLTIASLLSIILLILHVADDIFRGVDTAGPANLIALAVLTLLLYGTLVLAERRWGYITTLIVGIAAAGMPVINRIGRRRRGTLKRTREWRLRGRGARQRQSKVRGQQESFVHGLSFAARAVLARRQWMIWRPPISLDFFLV